ncbi:MAG TPA: hypothetical protein VGP82_01590 [Ktedonobacterales bacterium]|nr:hypothetical protein [Ktedonobacterales bacterium]
MVLALVANTMVAQLLYNSAGQLVLGDQVLLGYLLVSAICSTVAFALLLCYVRLPSCSPVYCMIAYLCRRWLDPCRDVVGVHREKGEQAATGQCLTHNT